MTEEQTEMLMYGLIWMGVINIKPVVRDNKSQWDKLRGLIKE